MTKPLMPQLHLSVLPASHCKPLQQQTLEPNLGSLNLQGGMQEPPASSSGRPPDPPFDILLADGNGVPVLVDHDASGLALPSRGETLHITLAWHPGADQLYESSPLAALVQHHSAQTAELQRRAGPQSHSLEECVEARSCLALCIVSSACQLCDLQQGCDMSFGLQRARVSHLLRMAS